MAAAPRTQHFKLDVVQRSRGQNAVKISAYCAAERMTCDGQSFDFSRKKSEHAGHAMLLPDGAPAWANDAESLWQHAEKFEKKTSSQTARICEIEIPRAVAPEHRLALLKHIAEPFRAAGMAVQCDVHSPLGSDNIEQPHGHLVMTLREFDGGDFAKKKTIGLEWSRWFQANKGRDIHKLISDRTNEFMSAHGIDCRVTHMSHAEQGIDTKPEQDVPKKSVEAWKAQPDHPAAEPFRATIEQREPRRQLRAAHRAATAWTAEARRLDGLLAAIEEKTPGIRKPGRRRGVPAVPWSSEWEPEIRPPVVEIQRGKSFALIKLADGASVVDRCELITQRGPISDDSLAAIARQAALHGWTEVEVTGDLSHRDRLAAALQARGIRTTNHGLASMTARRQAEKVLAAGKAAAEPKASPSALLPVTRTAPSPSRVEPGPVSVYAPKLVPPWAKGPMKKSEKQK